MPSAVRYGLAIPYRQAMPAVRVVVITAVVIAAFWTIGCSAGDPSVVTPSADVVSDEVATDAVDACGLLSAEDVDAVIGVPFDGVPSGVGARSVCVWQNPDTGESVTVEIGAPDSARGPDSTRVVGGAVEFSAGGRHNSVRVTTPAGDSAEESVAAAARLAERIRPQLPG
jgi:hypothetical protein